MVLSPPRPVLWVSRSLARLCALLGLRSLFWPPCSSLAALLAWLLARLSLCLFTCFVSYLVGLFLVCLVAPQLISPQLCETTVQSSKLWGEVMHKGFLNPSLN